MFVWYDHPHSFMTLFICLFRTPLMFITVLPFCAIAQSDTSFGNREQAMNTPSAKRFNLHFQTTYIYQYKPQFVAQYSGPNSLKTGEERENSLTATLYLGAR